MLNPMLPPTEPSCHSCRRTPACRQALAGRRTRGSVTVYFLIIASSLLLMGTFSFALGQAFLSKGQLQVVADSGARAAVAMLRDGELVARALDAANTIALRTQAIEQFHFLAGGDITIGDYDYHSGVFTNGGNQKATAVRVTANRTSSSFLGPLEIATGLYYDNNQAELETSSIATVGCREVVFAIDASGGMVEELDQAIQLVTRFKNTMEQSPLSGDKIGLVLYAGRGASLREYAIGGAPFWAGGSPDPLIQLSTDGVYVDRGLTALGQEGTCDNFRDRLMGARRGGCAGKGDNWGIDRSLELFEEMRTDTCSVESERLIILVTSGMPCLVFGPAINDFSTPYHGGTVADAYAAAERADTLGVSVAPVHLKAGAPGGGDWCTNKPLAFQAQGIPAVYLGTLARGFVEGVVDTTTQTGIDELLEDFTDHLSVRVVQ